MKKTILTVLSSLILMIGNAEDFHSTVSPITNEILSKMSYSWKDINPIPLSDLRCVTVNFYGYDSKVHEGSFVIHKVVADEIVDIFKEVFEARFPIEKMGFVDEYQGIDEVSAKDNNSYSFCCRPNTTNPSVFSKHSYGLAIDINPLENPYHRNDLIVPESGKMYLDRTLNTKGMIQPDSVIYNAFIKRGWSWGGDWPKTRGYADYQHFEKDPAVVLKEACQNYNDKKQ